MDHVSLYSCIMAAPVNICFFKSWFILPQLFSLESHIIPERGGEFWNFVKGRKVTLCVLISPHSPRTPVNLETWKLACTILTWMAQKLLSRLISSKFYIYIFNCSHTFKAGESLKINIFFVLIFSYKCCFKNFSLALNLTEPWIF